MPSLWHPEQQPATCSLPEHPVLHCRYNTKFMTDPDRAYAIGQINALDKETRLGRARGSCLYG
jgi:hypothetical protein